MKTITWLTPTYFIDVDQKIVPELSKTYRINWIISGEGDKPALFTDLKRSLHTQSAIEYYATNQKWFSPLSFVESKNKYKYILAKSDDIIYINQAPQLFDYLAAKVILPKNKTIFATHNVKTPHGARHEKLAKFYMKKLLEDFDNFQTFSKNQTEYLHSLFPNKNVLYAPLTLKSYGEKTERTRPDNVINFLAFGHIRDYKRIDLLIEAAQSLYECEHKKFIVTIAGNCPDWNKYQKLIKYDFLFDLQIGFVSDEKIPQLFANANYLVLPYQDLAQSGAITVAFNYNVPVIVSDILQFKEFVIEGINGFFFKSESVDSLKESMRNAILLSSASYQELLSSTQKFVETRYSLQAIAAKYINYLNKI